MLSKSFLLQVLSAAITSSAASKRPSTTSVLELEQLDSKWRSEEVPGLWSTNENPSCVELLWNWKEWFVKECGVVTKRARLHNRWSGGIYDIFWEVWLLCVTGLRRVDVRPLVSTDEVLLTVGRVVGLQKSWAKFKPKERVVILNLPQIKIWLKKLWTFW